ncbi:MAG: hypothetical protein ACRDRI_02180 [Pseudonocardiaceae bacterium]
MSAQLPERAVHLLVEPCPGCGATIDVRRIIALADDSATLSNEELWNRLTALTQARAR